MIIYGLYFIPIVQGTLGIQSYSQMMSKGCSITSEPHSLDVPWNHSQEVSQDPYKVGP